MMAVGPQGNARVWKHTTSEARPAYLIGRNSQELSYAEYRGIHNIRSEMP
jgi:hypothetical protein